MSRSTLFTEDVWRAYREATGPQNLPPGYGVRALVPPPLVLQSNDVKAQPGRRGRGVLGGRMQRYGLFQL
eukprot:1903935-Prymnesium_polylepis.1